MESLDADGKQHFMTYVEHERIFRIYTKVIDVVKLYK